MRSRRVRHVVLVTDSHAHGVIENVVLHFILLLEDKLDLVVLTVPVVGEGTFDLSVLWLWNPLVCELELLQAEKHLIREVCCCLLVGGCLHDHASLILVLKSKYRLFMVQVSFIISLRLNIAGHLQLRTVVSPEDSEAHLVNALARIVFFSYWRDRCAAGVGGPEIV
uniref:Uncharacterized protein n=1 Tax=Strombidium inclinatum TaxID=197538 RepID=A0A7S3IJX0_9SPIT